MTGVPRGGVVAAAGTARRARATAAMLAMAELDVAAQRAAFAA